MPTAVIAGASGLVGSRLLTRLLASPRYDRVVSLGRRRLPVDSPRLAQVVADLTDPAGSAAWEGWDALWMQGEQVLDAFSCLGTTIKQAGSKDAFRAVDHGAVLAVARATQLAGARGFWHVTAMGADPDSRVFYNRVKGEVERDVAALGVAATAAFRPSILDGERAEKRTLEEGALQVMRALAPVLGRFGPTHADHVAAAMLSVAAEGRPGDRVVGAGEIRRLARCAGSTDLGDPTER